MFHIRISTRPHAIVSVDACGCGPTGDPAASTPNWIPTDVQASGEASALFGLSKKYRNISVSAEILLYYSGGRNP